MRPCGQRIWILPFSRVHSEPEEEVSIMPESMITKRTLAAPLKELMNEEALPKITVGDICDHCGITRKSFYYHFKDKFDLVNWIFTLNLSSICKQRRIRRAEIFSTTSTSIFTRTGAFISMRFRWKGRILLRNILRKSCSRLRSIILSEPMRAVRILNSFRCFLPTRSALRLCAGLRKKQS